MVNLIESTPQSNKVEEQNLPGSEIGEQEEREIVLSPKELEEYGRQMQESRQRAITAKKLERAQQEQMPQLRERVNDVYISSSTEQVDNSPTIEQMNDRLKNNSKLQDGIKKLYEKIDEDARQQKIWQMEEIRKAGLEISDNLSDESTWRGRTIKWLMGETPKEREQGISYNAVALNKGRNKFKREYIPLQKTLEWLFYGKSEERSIEDKMKYLEGRNAMNDDG